MSSIQDFTDEIRARRRRDVEHQAHQAQIIHFSGNMVMRRKELVHNLTRLILDPCFSDLTDMTVAARHVGFRCHKAIVCAQSRVIREACREVGVGERPCIVKIKCHPLVFRCALEYLYTCDYTFYLRWDFPTGFLAMGQTVAVDPVDRLDCCELSLHLQVHILANCLRIPSLKYFTLWRIARVLERSSFPTVFPRFVREVYRTIPRQNALVKSILIDHADKVICGLRGRNHYDGRFPKYLFNEVSGFSRDFLAGRSVLNMPLDDYLNEWDGRIATKSWYC
ncbi:BTB/POZ domain-containing protein [Aspergillus stella-maris]|uniref:BTB/POZ domain-containing protein n=1 Tax=Aspergillus stella-maris TaxID=1810926 RepID=UPI003CCCCCBF